MTREVYDHASRCELTANVVGLLAGYGGDRVLTALVAAVAATTAVWSADEDEYHDDLLRQRLE